MIHLNIDLKISLVPNLIFTVQNLSYEVLWFQHEAGHQISNANLRWVCDPIFGVGQSSDLVPYWGPLKKELSCGLSYFAEIWYVRALYVCRGSTMIEIH